MAAVKTIEATETAFAAGWVRFASPRAPVLLVSQALLSHCPAGLLFSLRIIGIKQSDALQNDCTAPS